MALFTKRPPIEMPATISLRDYEPYRDAEDLLHSLRREAMAIRRKVEALHCGQSDGSGPARISAAEAHLLAGKSLDTLPIDLQGNQEAKIKASLQQVFVEGALAKQEIKVRNMVEPASRAVAEMYGLRDGLADELRDYWQLVEQTAKAGAKLQKRYQLCAEGGVRVDLAFGGTFLPSIDFGDKDTPGSILANVKRELTEAGYTDIL